MTGGVASDLGRCRGSVALRVVWRVAGGLGLVTNGWRRCGWSGALRVVWGVAGGLMLFRKSFLLL